VSNDTPTKVFQSIDTTKKPIFASWMEQKINGARETLLSHLKEIYRINPSESITHDNLWNTYGLKVLLIPLVYDFKKKLPLK
jgi:hypothetical protein